MSEEGARLLDALLEELAGRVRRGERPDVEAYARAHPLLADDLRGLFPVIAAMEGVKEEVGEPEDDPLPPVLDGYALRRELGRGSMGRVFEAAAPDGGTVALKVAYRRSASDPEYVERFRREAEAGRRVSHPGVVRTLGSGVVETRQGSLPYLVLEHVRGRALRALLDDVGHVPERLVRWTGARVAESLAALHAAGLVHGDVKPENVVIREDETLVLVDLGISRPSGPRSEGDPGFAGSFLYAAPEQVAGSDFGPAADLYALGVLLHEMATGRHPATAARAGATAPALSPFLAWVVGRLLEPDPAGRLADAAALADLLERGEASSAWVGAARGADGDAPPAPVEDAPPFVGREAEGRALDDAYEAAEEGRGCAVVVVGEAGVGKSRLVSEWLRALAARAERPRVVRAAGTATDPDPLAAALVRAVRRLPGETDGDRLGRLLPGKPVLAAALASRGAGGGEPFAREAARTAVVEVARALAAQRPLVVVFEDLHFAPPAARDAFESLARAVAGRRILLVGTARPGAGVEVPEAATLALEGLDATRAEALLAGALRAQGAPATTLEPAPVVRASEGNPLLLVEHAREAARAAREGRPSPRVAASARAQAAARAAALPDRERETLEAAACAGYEPDLLRVARALGRGPAAVLASSARLVRDGFLRDRGDRLAFRHHLVREAVHDAIPDARRAALHASLARALASEEVPPERAAADARAVALCDHALRGGIVDLAADVVARALGALRARGDSEAAVRLAEAALATTALRDDLRREVLLALGEVRNERGQHEACRPLLEECVRLARAAGDRDVEARALLSLGNAAVCRELEGGLALYGQAFEVARRSGDARLAGFAQAHLGFCLGEVERLDEGLSTSLAAAEALEALGDPAEAVARRSTTRILVALGRFDEAEREGLRARACDLDSGNRPGLAQTLVRLGDLAFRRARFAEALAWAREGLTLHREVGDSSWRDTATGVANALFELGRLDEASAAVEDAVAWARDSERPFTRIVARLAHGHVLAARGRLADALEAYEESASIVREIGEWRYPYPACHALEVHAVLGRFDRAEAVLEETAPDRMGPSAPAARAQWYAARGWLAEQREEWDRAASAYDVVRDLREGGGLQHGKWMLARGRALLRAGRPEDAREALERALGWGRESGAVRVAVLARAWLARLGAGDVLAARLALEEDEARLPVRDRMEAHAALFEASGEPAHLDRARAALAVLVAGAPPEDREPMATVGLHRRVARG